MVLSPNRLAEPLAAIVPTINWCCSLPTNFLTWHAQLEYLPIDYNYLEYLDGTFMHPEKHVAPSAAYITSLDTKNLCSLLFLQSHHKCCPWLPQQPCPIKLGRKSLDYMLVNLIFVSCSLKKMTHSTRVMKRHRISSYAVKNLI